MKRVFLLLCLWVSISATILSGQPMPGDERPENALGPRVTKANYELASRFTAKKVGQMVFSTRIRPNWFKDSDKFWYSWKTSQGTHYYIVNPSSGSKTEYISCPG